MKQDIETKNDYQHLETLIPWFAQIVEHRLSQIETLYFTNKEHKFIECVYIGHKNKEIQYSFFILCSFIFSIFLIISFITISIAISIAISLTITIAILLTITITIAILTFTHINTIDNSC